MKNLIPVNVVEFEDYLVEKLKLSDSQKHILRRENLLRFSKYKFYKKGEINTSILLRLTAPFYFLTSLLLFVLFPIVYFVRGEWDYPDFIYKPFAKWRKSLNL